MTEQTISIGRQRQDDEPAATAPPATNAWAEYLAAAQELDAARRGAATAAGEQAQSVQTAREELTGVRARLAPQQFRLRELGVPAMVLLPSPPEVSAAARAMVAGPGAVLAALREACVTADAADAALAGRANGRWFTPARNLLVYAPLALLVPVLQVLLYLYADSGWLTGAALICGLPMPIVAFIGGWLLVGRLFRLEPGEPVDRTPGLGAAVCLAPAVVTTVWIGVALLLR